MSPPPCLQPRSLQLLIACRPCQAPTVKATPPVPTPRSNLSEVAVHDQTSKSVCSAGSGLRPLEIARQRLHEKAVREPKLQKSTPLEDFERLFPLVDPSSPGLPYALFREYLFRCKRCDYVILKSRLNTHLCPTPGKANGVTDG